MSPSFRRAAHQALDILLDALADEERGEPKKRKRNTYPKPLPKVDASPELVREVEARLARAGYRKAGS